MKKVEFDPTTKAVTASFEGFLSFEEHSAISNSILDEAKKNGTSKIFIDTSNLKVVMQETKQWIESDWFPRASSNGIKHMAFLLPSDALGKMSTTSINRKSGSIEVQHFDNLTKAKEWLKSK